MERPRGVSEEVRVLLYLLLGVLCMVIGATAVYALWARMKRTRVTDIASFVCLLLVLFGFFVVIVSFKSGRVDADAMSTVVRVETLATSDGEHATTLVLKDKSRVVCAASQQACQQAQPGDIVVYTTRWSASGWDIEEQKVTFITPGPNSTR